MAVFYRLMAIMALCMLLCTLAYRLGGNRVWYHRSRLFLNGMVVLCLCLVGVFVLRRAAVFI